MHSYRVEWTGRPPRLCDGMWHLYKDGVIQDDRKVWFNHFPTMAQLADRGIPQASWDDYADDCEPEPAGTLGTFRRLSKPARPGLPTRWERYSDGLSEREWCVRNSFWLHAIDEDPAAWPLIYEAFRRADWRYESCGGCHGLV